MKYSLECNVSSKIKISSEIKVSDSEKEYIFTPNDKGYLERIKIIANVQNPEEFYSEIVHDPETNKALAFNIKGNKQLRDEIIREFWELESQMAFSFGLKRIFWSEPKSEVICETEEERERVQIFSSSWKKEYSDPDVPLTQIFLKEMIESKKDYSSLNILKSFWREGKNEFNSFRYIQAFFNFYFVIEGIYGNGKPKNSDVEKEFRNSEEFSTCLDSVMKNVAKKQRHIVDLQNKLSQRSKQYDADGMIDLIIKTRGSLHHYVKGSSLNQGTPFNQNDFESIALFMLGLSTMAISMQIMEINKSKIKCKKDRKEIS